MIKPRITKGLGEWWLCKGGGLTGQGPSPVAAYMSWALGQAQLKAALVGVTRLADSTLWPSRIPEVARRIAKQ